ncbi:uncharacterized protein C15orf39 homolog [Labrus mixtus]|uniref:uncharacterized protein C15orf39 homolog n=1 Tax=Labrus mixtus TaxID=508554 RepID=UPI0029BFF0C9|nr:uncharacterized protein C15orf39 homolog [Labrus mixtus]
MSSQSIPSHIDPLFGRKMPLYDGTISSAGLSKPQTMSDLRGGHTLQYSGACFPYDPRGKEAAEFTPPWRKTPLLYDRNPVSHLSGREGQNHIIYRQDSSSSEESHPSSLHQAAVKQGFTLYTKSPRMSSPAAATSGISRKQKNGTEKLSPPSENTIYLAIPKPVYGLSPCCSELGCVIGHRYSVEHGSPRIPKQVYEHEWMQTDAHYTERGKAQDAMLQQRGLPCEPSAEALRRMTVGTYSPGRDRTFPAMIDPNYSSYPFALPHTLFGSLSEQGQRIQTSPRGYPSFYPSHPTYEHMTSEVYQEHSPMSKYGQLTQQPMFYYPQANVEVENRTQCKDIGSKQREDVPVILKHSISDHREHYMVPQTLHGKIPLPLSDETLHNHSLMRGFNHQAFAVPGLHSNTSQIRQLLNSNRRNVSPSRSYMDHPMTSASNLRKDRPNANLPQTTSPFHVNQTSPSRGTSQPGISPSSIEVNRFYPPLTGLHVDRPVLPPTALNADQLRDYSSFEAQVKCPMQAKGLPVSSWAWLPRPLHHSSGSVQTSLPDSVNVPKIIYSHAVTPGKNVQCHISSPSTAVPKKCLKRSMSHSSSPVKIEKEDRELCQMDLFKKRQKVKMENIQEKNKSDSCMPIIDNVFSLAPYQAYLQAPGLLFPGRVSQIIAHSSEHREVKSRPDIKEDKQQPEVCLLSKEVCADTPTENPGVEMIELKNIKVEKVDPSDKDNSVETSLIARDCSKEMIQKESKGTDSSNQEPMLVIKKVDPDELEAKPLQEEQKEAADESKPGEETAPTNISGQGDALTPQEKLVTIKPNPNTSPQLLENRLKFKNIPPQCLKLSSYKIVFHGINHSSPVLPLEKTPVKPMTEFAPKPEPQTPVRKHFFELHHSLCKLVSKSVLVPSKHDLKTWLSQLELSGPASPPTKVKKISCLFGIKGREVWLTEEMKSALHTLLERLREYTAQERCPFPHVMRTGAVFLPMLVVKELLFPTVQGSLIDQVLQEHKVELRPTTLSEEKILIQLHKRACSSRLRKLMSLKHLPDIYADVVNLMYYTCVCKHLESTSPDGQKKVQD